MKKLIILSLVIFYFSNANQVFAQGIWKDGIPLFTLIDEDSSQNVKVDSLITLTPLDSSSEQDTNFQFILFGLDWSWPDEIRIVSSEDIDYRNFFGSDLYLITDAVGRRVVEIDPAIPEEVWEFDGQLGTDRYLEKPVDSYSYVENSIRKILITDQGRHRVIKVIRENKAIQWQYGDETEGNGFNQLSSPADAIPMPDSGKVFICDKSNNRVILVNEADTTIAWNWGLGELNKPVDIEYDQATQNVLITDQSNHRVLKVNINSNATTWHFGERGEPGDSDTTLNLPTDADLLPNGNVLICDAGNNRIIEVNSTGDIVWKFSRNLENLRDIDRLADNKHLIVNGNFPSRLGYTNNDFISEMKDIGTEVGFDSLFWLADTLSSVTSIQLQLRTENTLGDLESAPWCGPTEQDSFYTKPGMLINHAHNGHRFYQFKARLLTNNHLNTPVLNDVILNYKYFDTEKTGKIVTEIITDSIDYIITNWKNLKFNTKLPENLANRNKVELKITILDGETNEALRSYTASNVDTINEEVLSNVEKLKQKQSIRIQVTLKTNNTSVTPALNSLALEWERAFSIDSQIYFVNENFSPVSLYRFTSVIQTGEPYIDRVIIFLDDPNLEQMQDAVKININALNSLDAEEVSLNRLAGGGFRLQPSMPGVILDTGFPYANDKILQVLDRDTLVISYTDPTNPNDQSSDSVLVIQNTKGIIQFVNQYADTIHSASIGDSIFVEIIDEQDRDITPLQDTISVIVFDYETGDEEPLSLAEVADVNNQYNTGHFFSITGLPLVLNDTRKDNDGFIQTVAGRSTIGIKYFDTIAEIPILQVSAGTTPIDTLWNFGAGPLHFDIAPNPFYESKHNSIKIRVSSSIGSLYIEKIEIYTLAGEKVNELEGDQLNFYYNHPTPKDQFAFADDWWDLRTKNGTKVSSGTYFVKVYGQIIESSKQLSEIKKMIIIR